MPSGIHINKIIHESWVALSSGATLKLQLPTTGNLRVLAFAAGLNNIDITSITDSDGSAWSLKQTERQFGSDLVCGEPPRQPGSDRLDPYLRDKSDELDAVFRCPGRGNFAVRRGRRHGFDALQARKLRLTIMPTITTTGANELVIATMGIGDGPGLGMASGAPSGAVWDFPTYSGEIDLDLMENADAAAHVYTGAASTEHWNWTITSNGDNSCSSEAVAFKPAP